AQSIRIDATTQQGGSLQSSALSSIFSPAASMSSPRPAMVLQALSVPSEHSEISVRARRRFMGGSLGGRLARDGYAGSGRVGNPPVVCPRHHQTPPGREADVESRRTAPVGA